MFHRNTTKFTLRSNKYVKIDGSLNKGTIQAKNIELEPDVFFWKKE